VTGQFDLARQALAGAMELTRRNEDHCGMTFLTCATGRTGDGRPGQAEAVTLIEGVLPALRRMSLRYKHDQMTELLTGRTAGAG
jgi:hypothetical protein